MTNDATASMPKALEAEMALLGWVLERPTLLDEPKLWDVDLDLVADPLIRRALEALRREHDDGRDADLVTAEQPLRRAGIEGWAVLLVDAEAAASRTVPAALWRVLEETAYLRRLWRLGDNLRRVSSCDDPVAIRESVEIAVERLTHNAPRSGPVPVGLADGLRDFVGRVLGGEEGPSGWATGFRHLDRVLRGLKPGELTVVAARPSVGKSAFAQQVALAVGRQDGRVLFVSAEMSGAQVYPRLASMLADVDNALIESGRLVGLEAAKVRGTPDKVPATIRLWDAASVTTRTVAAEARKEWAARGLDLLVIDHLGYLSDTPERGESRAVLIGRMTKRLKALGKTLGCHVLLVSQLNRSSEEGATMREPGLSELRDSGEIEQDADTVLLLHRDTREAITGSIIVGKNRQGPTCRIPLVWHPTTTRFQEAA